MGRRSSTVHGEVAAAARVASGPPTATGVWGFLSVCVCMCTCVSVATVREAAGRGVWGSVEDCE